MSQPQHPADPPAVNPYAPSSLTGDDAIADHVAGGGDRGVTPKSVTRIGLRWLLVCGLSAIPSFVFGIAVTDGRIAGMICGIAVFVLLYTYLDYQTATWSIRQKKTIQRTLKIAYGTRVAISIVFPLGMYADVICGLISVQLTQTVTGVEFSASDPMGFGSALLTTLVQGTVLNVVLGAYALLVHGIQLALIASRN